MSRAWLARSSAAFRWGQAVGKANNLLRLADALRAVTVNRPPATLKAVADSLRARRDSGEPLTERQREFIALDDAGPPSGVITGPGMAIPDNLLPPAMRNGGVELGFARELIAKAEGGEWVDPDRLAAARSMVKRDERQRAAQVVPELEPA